MRKGLAIVNMLIFVVIFSILSGVVLGLLSSSTRDMEKSIRRTKGFYVAQAGIVYALDAMRLSGSLPAAINIPWTHDSAGNVQTVKTVTPVNAGPAIAGCTPISVTCDYTVNW
jgi:hypothetical protein